MILNENQLDMYSKCIFLNETLETKLTKPFIGKEITLYHGSNKKFDYILPNSRNIGTKLSTFRMSSFWTTEKQIAILFAIHQILQDSGKIKSNAFDFKDNSLLIAKDMKANAIKLLENSSIYIYEKTVPTKIIGRGNDTRINEFTVDIKIRPDKVIILNYNDFKQFITYVDNEVIDKIYKDYKAGKTNIKKNGNIMEKLVFYSFKDFEKKMREFKKYSE